MSTYIDRRHNLIQLNHEIEDHWKEFGMIVDRDNIDSNSQRYQQLYSEYRSYTEIPEGYRDAILTKVAVERALRWQAPLPPRDSGNFQDNEYWYWDRVVKRYLLTAAGHRFIRHEIAEEREIAYRPILAWAAIGISFLSLIVSLLKS